MKTKKTPIKTIAARVAQLARMLGLRDLERNVRDAAADPLAQAESARWMEWWWFGLVTWNELAAALMEGK